MVKGRLPPRIVGLIAEWTALHREELFRDWKLMRSGRSPNRIAPLE
jgi:hypothetical protein